MRPVAHVVDDVDHWYADLAAEVESHGAPAAFARHIREIVDVHRSDVSERTLLGRDLHELLVKDPELRPHLEAAPTAAAGVLDVVLEGDGTPMRCLPDRTFENWGRTVRNVPSLTVVPKTVTGLRNLVRWASENGKTVRASGYRHTWTDLYAADGEVLVSLLDPQVVETLPAPEPPIDPHDELQGIEIVGEIDEAGVRKALCRIGAATTNEQFRRWCLDPAGGNWAWTVPLNVIMVEITWGGSNAPICHGAGLRHQTLSDLVHAIEFVNAKGELQTVDDPELLRTAAGAFGLLGIVTAITLKLDPMSYAVMRPEKTPVALTVPPPAGFRVPSAIDMRGVTPADLDAAWQRFVEHCEHDYYAEWFWFPFQSECWVNCWNDDGRREDAQPYPTEIQTFIEQAESYLAQLAVSSVFDALPAEWQAKLLATTAMAALPDGETFVAPVIDALHFRRGIQNFRVRDMELEIPIPPRADDPSKPDWTVAQRAWWTVIAAVYGRDDAPMRIALEMRIMGGSDITMAPQFDNALGTCSIEVLTTLNVADNVWSTFKQRIADDWDSLVDAAGNRLNVRPHWAKEWEGLSFRGRPAVDHLRDVAYKDRIPEFTAGLEAIAAAGGYARADMDRLFGNRLLREVLWGGGG